MATRPYADDFKPLTSIDGVDLFVLRTGYDAGAKTYAPGVYFYEAGDYRLVPLTDEVREVRDFHRDARSRAAELAGGLGSVTGDSVVAVATAIFNFLTEE